MGRISNVIRAYLPQPVKSALKPLRRMWRRSFLGGRIEAWLSYRELRSNFLYDARRYFHHAALNPNTLTRSNLQAKIVAVSHCIEKGLSHPAPRLRFGQQHIDILLACLPEYIEKCGHDLATAIGLGVLTEYCRLHERQGVRLESLESALEKLKAMQSPAPCSEEAAGAVSATRTEIHAAGKTDIEGFLKSRHSIRHFDTRRVEEDLIRRAVSLAITTPSVCNRQMWKARVFRDVEMKRAILDLQTGNRGFQEEIDTLILVTCDLQHFASIGERNEAWIDGGMFAMTLTLALHSLGLGTCCLNWSVEQDRDRQLRRLMKLPESEVVVLLIAVGHIPKRLMVARSTRKPLEEILVWG
jgi:nitroreductase